MYIAFTDLKVRMILQTYLMLVLINKLSWKANLQELNLSHQETSNVNSSSTYDDQYILCPTAHLASHLVQLQDQKS